MLDAAAELLAERGFAATSMDEIAARVGVSKPTLYQHFLARDAHELETIEQAVDATLRHVLSMGGTVAAEHGIGKIKRKWLELQLSPVQLGLMRAIKRELDPAGILAPGNVFA